MKFKLLMTRTEVRIFEAPDLKGALRAGLDVLAYHTAPVDSCDVTPIGDEARLDTYTCWHCGTQALKEDWGPGRVRCPDCGKLAPSACEGKD